MEEHRSSPAKDEGDDRERESKRLKQGEAEEEEEETSTGLEATAQAQHNEEEEEEEDEEDDQEETSSQLLAMIEAAARAQGIPMEWILRRLHEEENGSAASEDDEDIEYPFDHVPQNLKDVADFIQSNKCRNILVLAGAGMSVASGIPDFRSPNGLYATLDAQQLTASDEERAAIQDDPSSALDQHLFLRNPLPCLELQREFLLGTRAQRWKATLAHRFLELLHVKTNKLVRQYTQNIDGLEDQCTRLPQNKVIAVHGSMDRAECAVCEHTADFGTFCSAVQTQIKDITGQDDTAPATSTPIVCDQCGQPTLKPAIVLFRSSLPRVFFERLPDDVEEVDLLLVIGTSLRVAPANSIVWRVPKSAMRVLVNREAAGEFLGMDFDPETSKSDYFAQGDIDQVLLELMNHLGWVDELNDLLPDRLPASSAALLRQLLQDNKSSAAEPRGEAASVNANGQPQKQGVSTNAGGNANVDPATSSAGPPGEASSTKEDSLSSKQDASSSAGGNANVDPATYSAEPPGEASSTIEDTLSSKQDASSNAGGNANVDATS